ncbi:MAG TPA: FKBP-type peptidyl-prolyl cis-trans isomerase [Moraxellaceae bacterium]|nr:FKBP-type peptidyl-prolyl cis-trans isomerase [Moraxellaceae bacterium]
MKRQIMAAGLVVVAGVALVACKDQKKPESADARAAYTLGYMTGMSSIGRAPNLDADSFSAGFKDAYAKKQPRLNQDEMKAAMMSFEDRMKREEEMAQKKGAIESQTEGATYLAANAKKPGVKQTASGLQYEVITEGSGPHPTATSVVKVHYEGKLVNGQVFDSSRQRGQPVEFPLNQVIPGWTEGVQLMSKGGRYRFTVPANLGYGAEGAGPIPPNSVLVFDIELLDFH